MQKTPPENTNLTKRELFALHTMQGIVSKFNDGSCLDSNWDRKSHCRRIAALAVDLADALLETLEKDK
ncbi:hypothetical protein C7H19_09515 [Aphanothece hegewaldii CCALA 016]|uniref:Uncharacterized protein n=1 Tax=Aphanothece hegewaldii CCALA 016 TaxID=2107694 RepID=A0A2T1LZI0_9CHRO|nr:hypothetical protein [Aphanothece hegewaldii]PSF37771.1 hypothetical protein C7H19_09515 [Aphanothece hegewaldii CCALA 016]